MLDEALLLSEFRDECEVECRDAEDNLAVLEMAAGDVAVSTIGLSQVTAAAVHEQLEPAEAAAVAAEGAVLQANSAARRCRATLDAALNEAAEAAGAEPLHAGSEEHRVWTAAQQAGLKAVRSSQALEQWQAAHTYALECVKHSVMCTRAVEVVVAAASVADALEGTLDTAAEVRTTDAMEAAAAALQMAEQRMGEGASAADAWSDSRRAAWQRLQGGPATIVEVEAGAAAEAEAERLRPRPRRRRWSRSRRRRTRGWWLRRRIWRWRRHHC